MDSIIETISDHLAFLFILGIIGFFTILALFYSIFGSKCPKCKKRGVRKTGEDYLGENLDTTFSQEFIAVYKCKKCGYSWIDYECKSKNRTFG